MHQLHEKIDEIQGFWILEPNPQIQKNFNPIGLNARMQPYTT
jgi:hypothetical protein